jgi:TetR/AcrR family transcriptional repressor of lmrAB and yxaGH operons
MPPALLSRQEVIERLMLVVRRCGYDGASLAELSKATGLGKSSLYHYFPAGKDDMVRAVLERLESQLRDLVFTPLRTPGPARRRVEGMVKTLDAYYRGGREACVLGNLVLGTSRARFKLQLRAIFDEWIDALAVALVDGGLSHSLARARAEAAVMRIEGALVLARAMDDVALFGRALKQLPAELLAPAPRRA